MPLKSLSGITSRADEMTAQIAASLQSFVLEQRAGCKVCSRLRGSVGLQHRHPIVRSHPQVAGPPRPHRKRLSYCTRQYAMASQHAASADFASLQQVALQAAETGAQVCHVLPGSTGLPSQNGAVLICTSCRAL